METLNKHWFISWNKVHSIMGKLCKTGSNSQWQSPYALKGLCVTTLSPRGLITLDVLSSCFYTKQLTITALNHNKEESVHCYRPRFYQMKDLTHLKERYQKMHEFCIVTKNHVNIATVPSPAQQQHSHVTALVSVPAAAINGHSV